MNEATERGEIAPLIDAFSAAMMAAMEVIEDRTNVAVLMPRVHAVAAARSTVDAAVSALRQRAVRAEQMLEDIRHVAEQHVAVDLAHDDPAHAVSIMGQMITMAREAGSQNWWQRPIKVLGVPRVPGEYTLEDMAAELSADAPEEADDA